MGAAVVFFAASALLGILIGVRAVEERRGIRVFQDVRSRYDRRIAEAYTRIVANDFPIEIRQNVSHALHWLSHRIVVLAVEMVRAIERPLTRLSYRLRTRAPKPSGKDVSPFLRTITPEKRTGDGSTPPREV